MELFCNSIYPHKCPNYDRSSRWTLDIIDKDHKLARAFICLAVYVCITININRALGMKFHQKKECNAAV